MYIAYYYDGDTFGVEVYESLGDGFLAEILADTERRSPSESIWMVPGTECFDYWEPILFR